MKKANNQGFSLVELIIVIAIMAVLIGVLAPQFLKYVERSREQKDASAIEELRNATEIALANEAVYQQVTDLITAAAPATSMTVNVSAAGAITTSLVPPTGTDNELLQEITDTIGTTINLSSNKYASGATVTITPNATGAVTVTAAPVTP